jgi:hypothetical protein
VPLPVAAEFKSIMDEVAGLEWLAAGLEAEREHARDLEKLEVMGRAGAAWAPQAALAGYRFDVSIAPVSASQQGTRLRQPLPRTKTFRR